MDWFVKAFVRSSALWLSAGATLGVAMAARPAWAIYRPAHAHMLLLGFVAMMIFGVAYHVLPRFAGVPLHSPRAAGWHVRLANAGLALMIAGFVLRVHAPSIGSVVLATGGTLSAIGAYTFAYLVWRTVGAKPAPKLEPIRARPPRDLASRSG